MCNFLASFSRFQMRSICSDRCLFFSPNHAWFHAHFSCFKSVFCSFNPHLLAMKAMNSLFFAEIPVCVAEISQNTHP
jgi:hypothetical protein